MNEFVETIESSDMGIEVYFANGLRKIKPYYHSRTSFAKGRWLNRKLLEVLSSEFRSQSSEEYAKAIIRQEFQIIRENIALSAEETLQTTIQNKDLIKTTSHKHEPPVKQWNSEEISKKGSTIAGIEIIHECDEMLVLNKPSGVPIHPTGQYYQNTLVEILNTHGRSVLPSHRLDKVTSGVLILAKNSIMANKIQRNIREHRMQKVYLVRVDGQFPKVDTLGDSDATKITMFSKLFSNPSKFTTEKSAMFTVEMKKQFPAAFSVAREATTIFYPVKYFPDTNETLVACQPLTGRTHQIRIHLARLGHPISNDSFYNYKITKFPRRLSFILGVNDWNDGKHATADLEIHFDEFVRESEKVQLNSCSSSNKTCPECGGKLYSDPELRDLELYLHAWKYSDVEGEMSFETSLPAWAFNNDPYHENRSFTSRPNFSLPP
ncbi:LADA_0D11056g1_1 [Lachancea dasiensis]|uniref:LADA_0D11056g1_1 n=1 Tax=Lachancea dasiensis TaxID=1072105 RepID=A0A1G4J7T1_9SACH|nr:LADA_0D11056g1_1 [Lachancea dasiensis]